MGFEPTKEPGPFCGSGAVQSTALPTILTDTSPREEAAVLKTGLTGLEPALTYSTGRRISRYATDPFSSERRGSNAQQPRWRRGTLPVELLSHIVIVRQEGVEPPRSTTLPLGLSQPRLPFRHYCMDRLCSRSDLNAHFYGSEPYPSTGLGYESRNYAPGAI